MNREREPKSADAARRGAARAERERQTLRAQRYAQRLEREGRAPVPPPTGLRPAVARAIPLYEVEVIPGLEEYARAELRGLLHGPLPVRAGALSGTLSFPFRGDPQRLLSLTTVAAVYRVHRFDVPRPRALLGEEHLQTLVKLVEAVLSLHPEASFRTFRFSAAGATSTIFGRLTEMLERRTGLRPDPEAGDLLIRVRPTAASPGGPAASGSPNGPGFEVLLRLTPRPMSARPWRVCNLPGALNATVARVMVALTSPAAHDRFVNLTCGSGTLMIERLALGPARLVIGGDRDPEALRCARANIIAAGCERRAALVRWDAGRLPLADASVNVLCADLPYGMLVGSRRENERLYPALVGEAARVALPGAVMVLITQAVSLLDQSLEKQWPHWTLERRFEVQIPFKSGMLRPKVSLLRRSGRR